MIYNYVLRMMKNIKVNNLNIRFYSSSIGFKNKALILLNGLPGKPKDYEVISKLNNLGFDVFMPEYEGTWDSSGSFLSTHPAFAIDEFIKSIVCGINISGALKYSTDNIYVLGSSFGGWVGLSINNFNTLKKVCLLSPVIKFQHVRNISTLGDYLKQTFPNDYRFEYSNWSLLINDKIEKNESVLTSQPDKVMIVAGRNDDQIDINEIVQFSKSRDIKLDIEDVGHITFSKISEEIMIKILKFFDISRL